MRAAARVFDYQRCPSDEPFVEGEMHLDHIGGPILGKGATT